MVAVQNSEKICSVIRDERIMSGQPVVSGTRIPADIILAYLRAGHSEGDIFLDYPIMPPGGVNAVKRWAETELGSDWMTSPSSPVDPREL